MSFLWNILKPVNQTYILLLISEDEEDEEAVDSAERQKNFGPTFHDGSLRETEIINQLNLLLKTNWISPECILTRTRFLVSKCGMDCPRVPFFTETLQQKK